MYDTPSILHEMSPSIVLLSSMLFVVLCSISTEDAHSTSVGRSL